MTQFQGSAIEERKPRFSGGIPVGRRGPMFTGGIKVGRVPDSTPEQRTGSAAIATSFGDQARPVQTPTFEPRQESAPKELPPEFDVPAPDFEFAKGLGRGAVGLATSPIHLAATAKSLIGSAVRATTGIDPGTLTSVPDPELVSRWVAEGEKRLTTNGGLLAKHPILEGKTFAWRDPNWWAGAGGETLAFLMGMMIPGLGAARVTQAAGMSARAAGFIGLVTSGASSAVVEAGTSRQSFIEGLTSRGMSQDEAERIASMGAGAYGIVAGVLDAVPLVSLLRRVPGGRAAVMRLLTTAATESATEVAQEALAIQTERTIGIPTTREEATQRMLAAGTLGAAAGGVAAAITTKRAPPQTAEVLATPEGATVLAASNPELADRIADAEAPSRRLLEPALPAGETMTGEQRKDLARNLRRLRGKERFTDILAQPEAPAAPEPGRPALPPAEGEQATTPEPAAPVQPTEETPVHQPLPEPPPQPPQEPVGVQVDDYERIQVQAARLPDPVDFLADQTAHGNPYVARATQDMLEDPDAPTDPRGQIERVMRAAISLERSGMPPQGTPPPSDIEAAIAPASVAHHATASAVEEQVAAELFPESVQQPETPAPPAPIEVTPPQPTSWGGRSSSLSLKRTDAIEPGTIPPQKLDELVSTIKSTEIGALTRWLIRNNFPKYKPPTDAGELIQQVAQRGGDVRKIAREPYEIHEQWLKDRQKRRDETHPEESLMRMADRSVHIFDFLKRAQKHGNKAVASAARKMRRDPEFIKNAEAETLRANKTELAVILRKYASDILQRSETSKQAELTPEQKVAIRQETNRRGHTIFGPGFVRALGWFTGRIHGFMVPPLHDRLTQMGGTQAPRAAVLVQDAASDADRVHGAISQELDTALKMSGRRVLASVWLQGIQWGHDAGGHHPDGVARLADAVEGRLPVPSRRAMEIVRALNVLIDAGGRQYENINLLRRRAGQPELFLVIPGGKVFPYVATDNFFAMMQAGPGNEVWVNFRNGVARRNGLPPDHVEAMMVRQRNEMLSEQVTPGEKRVNAEIAREWRYRPTHVMAGGEIVQLYETNPYMFADRYAANLSNRIGFLSQFGQNISGLTAEEAMLMGVNPSIVSEIMNAFQREYGRTNELRDAIRALNGKPVEDPWADSGSAAAPYLRGMRNILSILRASLLTGALPLNLFEFVANPQAFGRVSDHARVIARLSRHPWQMMGHAEQQGTINRDILNMSIDPNRPITSFARLATVVLDRFSGNHFLNEKVELYGALLAMEMSARMRAGRGGSDDVFNLMSMGFDRATAQRMADGNGTPQEYTRFETRAAPRLSGGKRRGVDKSRAQHNKVYRAAIAFTTYATPKLHLTARQFLTYGRLMEEARRTGNWRLAVNSTQKFSRFLVGTAVANQLAYFLLALFTGGKEGLERAWAEQTDSTWKGLMEAWVYGTFAGPFGAMIRVARDIEKQHPVLSAARATIPGFLIDEIWKTGFLPLSGTARGPYKDRSPLEVAHVMFNRFTPGTPMLRNFAAIFGFGSREDLSLRDSISAYRRWRSKNAPRGFGEGPEMPEEQRVFRLHMRRAYEAITKGKYDQADVELVNALGLSDRNIADARASILNRQLLHDLNAGQLEALAKHIGQDAYQRLVLHDRILELWAGQRGARISPQRRQRALIQQSVLQEQP